MNLSHLEIRAFNRRVTWQPVNIYVKNNSIYDLSRFIIQNIPLLAYIDLRLNSLSYFPDDSSIINVTSIETLDLRHNELTHLPTTILALAMQRLTVFGATPFLGQDVL